MTPSRDTPGVIAPPPLIYAVPILAGWWLHRVRPLPVAPSAALGVVRLLGVVVAVAGVALAAWGAATFRRARTSVNPLRPATALVSGGPYRFTRNPMYVGMAAVVVGVALWIGDAWPIVLLVPALWVMRVGVIAREERYLEAKFGDAYRAYVERVSRWL